MIRLSLHGKMMYEMLNQTVLLLLLYAVGFLLAALFQHPAHPLPPLAESPIRAFAAALLRLTILTGFVTAGIAMRPSRPPSKPLMTLRRAWTALVIVTALLSPFEVSWLLDGAMIVLLLAWLGLSLTGRPSAFLRVWQVGIFLTALSLAAEHLAGREWTAVIGRFQFHAAYGLCGVSVFFWLMTRWSQTSDEWARDGVRIAAVSLAVAGGIISLAPVVPSARIIGALLIPLCHLILAGHSYRVLRERGADASLSPHWMALAALYWLIGGGFLGAFGIYLRRPDGYLSDAQQGLIGWVMLAIALGFVNGCAAELRGDNRRVTGYAPFWLIGFGVGLATVVQVCRGAVELYLREVFALDAASIAGLLLPLTVIWLIGLLAAAMGILIYALGFWARRPQILAVDSDSSP